MNRVDRIIKEISDCDEVDLMEYDFGQCCDLLQEMRSAMQTFVDRVEAGAIRSITTYKQFKEILDKK